MVRDPKSGLVWWVAGGAVFGSLLGCAPGTLSDDEQRDLRRELDRLYGAEEETEAEETEAEETEAETEPDEEPTDSDTEETEETTDDSEAGEIPDCVQQIFTTSCSGSACHYDGVFNFPPDYERDDLFELLTTEETTCADVDRYVDLDDPEQSLILLKLGDSPPCGTTMPPETADPLTSAQMACMEDWFDALAQ